MAAYPSYGILLDATRTTESKWRDDVSDTGTLHSRQMRSSEYIQFDLVHHLTTAQYRALMTSYNSGERADWTLTYFSESPAVTYTVKFIEPPNIIRNHGNGRHDVRVRLRGTQD